MISYPIVFFSINFLSAISLFSMTRVALKVRILSVRLTTIQSTNIKPKQAECKTITAVQWFCRYTRIDYTV